LNGRDCRHFELELALGLRLIKTAALAHRASRIELSEWLFAEAQKELCNVRASLQVLDSADQLRFTQTTEELSDRIEEYERLLSWKRSTHGRVRRAGTGSGG